MENFGGDMAPNITAQVNLPSGKGLWNPLGFLVLSPLFSFLPAAILYSLNYGRLGYAKKRNASLLVSCLAFAGAISLVYFIDQNYVRSIFVGLNMGAGVFFYNDQGKLYKAHLAEDGRKASYVIPVIVSLVITAGVLWAAFYTINVPDQSLVVNGSELYYTKNVEKAEAEKLADYLGKVGLFRKDNEISVKLDKRDKVYIFSLIVDKERLNDDEIVRFAEDLSYELSYAVFNYSKVEVNLCDDVFKPLKTVSYRK